MRNVTGGVLLAAGLVLGAVLAPAQAPGWKASLKGVTIPGKPAAGRIHGKPFRVERGELQGKILTLRQGKEFFADREVLIFLMGPGSRVEGKTYTVEPDMQTGGIPHIHMRWWADRKSVPTTEMHMSKYAMRLQFGKRKNGKITGQVYLCTPDAQKSFVAGYFTAVLK